MARVAVMGSGAFGITFAQICADAGGDVRLFARRPGLADRINERRDGDSYLPSARLPRNVSATADPAEALLGSDVVVFAIPTAALGAQLLAWAERVPRTATLISLSRGINEKTLRTGSQTIEEALGDVARVVALAGPYVARDYANRSPGVAVVACPNTDHARAAAAVSGTDYFRLQVHGDRLGCEIAGAGKTVVALAVGLADGFMLGDNARAAIVSRGLVEMARLGQALGGDVLTFTGLPGVGGLLACCASVRGPDREVGFRVAQGRSLGEAVSEVDSNVEGPASSLALMKIAGEVGVDVPITNAVASIVRGERSPAGAVRSAMEQSDAAELEGLASSSRL